MQRSGPLCPGARHAGPRGRSEALRALDARDPETRRLGAAELAEHGTMQDVPRLAAALRDPDQFVRKTDPGVGSTSHVTSHDTSTEPSLSSL